VNFQADDDFVLRELFRRRQRRDIKGHFSIIGGRPTRSRSTRSNSARTHANWRARILRTGDVISAARH
jgi:hypothetical protein